MTQTAEPIYTPSELNREIKLHLEAGFPRVLLEAEVSNLAKPASGHMYFTLKDSKAQIRCAMFRSAAVRARVSLENGIQVLARGRISLYEPRGDYQFIVESVEAAGEGLLQRQFEELKKRLGDEGLFDPALKTALPAYPQRIGLITSASGAAVRDLLHVLGRRWPVAVVRLYPVAVQGPEAVPQIRAALAAANRQAWAQVLILGRGGGSLEDLAAFNDESVARAVGDSTIPVVSAVGHETDFSITDFVADLRAPTPSAAAELATPDAAALRSVLSRFGRQLSARTEARLQQEAQKLDHASHRLMQRHPASSLQQQQERLVRLQLRLHRSCRQRLSDCTLHVDTLTKRFHRQRPDRLLSLLSERLETASRALNHHVRDSLRSRQAQFGALTRTLQAVSPLQTIGRGYSIITGTESGTVISRIGQVNPGDQVVAKVSDGRLDCTVDRISPGDSGAS